mgnify:FL=1
MKNLKKQKGFALPVSLMLLVVMTLMGIALVSMTSSDMSSNNDRDNSSQAFYAAESGISMAKDWLTKQNTYQPGSNPDGQLRFCKTSLFPTLRPGAARALKDASGRNHVGKSNLSQLRASSSKEATRLGKFSFEYFITLTPDRNGFTNSEQKNPQGFVYYTIYSCGCDGSTSTCSSQNNNISAIEAVVTIR